MVERGTMMSRNYIKVLIIADTGLLNKLICT
jgi:hypothetical protein